MEELEENCVFTLGKEKEREGGSERERKRDREGDRQGERDTHDKKER